MEFTPPEHPSRRGATGGISMLIENWMTKDIVCGTPEMSMMKASKIMKERGVGRLPVVNEVGVLLGLVSDRDIKEASPSKATTLDMHEL
jgi:acetoin utilization protein AcuB